MKKTRINENIILNSNRDNRYRSQNIWEIDGVIKSATKWCKEYDEQPSFVLSRIVNHRCTPKEALTFPKKKNWKYNTVEELWESKGLIPGTDTTSRVISINYLGHRWIDTDTVYSRTCREASNT